MLSFESTFKVLLIARLFAAVFSNIQDCDEVFNYWEPSHYLQYGIGFQTWEYAPQYAIRSWAYLLPHTLWKTMVEFVFPEKVFNLI